MIPVKLSDILRAIGEIDETVSVIPEGNPFVTGLCIDSRKAVAGSLFVAFDGEKSDGHDYIEKAFENGAAAVIGSNPQKLQSAQIPEGRALILTKDPLLALGRIGQLCRERYEGHVIGITGSVGKTSTKDLVYAVLSGKYSVMKTLGNYNNPLGLPLTLSNLGPDTQAAVIEMGMEHAGDIDYLSSLTEPHFGIVTNIGTSHIENLGSREGILHAKLELVEHLCGEKKLFLNGDDPLLYSVKDSLGVKPEYFGRAAHNDCVLLEDAKHLENGMLEVKAHYRDTDYVIQLDTLGVHMGMNVLPALMVGASLGLSPEEIQAGLNRYEATPHRLQRIKTDRYLLIDDTYNASPTSMKSALDTLMELAGGRRVAVLGDIFEMGDFSREGHEEVGRYASMLGLDCLLTCGEHSRSIHEAFLEASKGKNIKLCEHFETLEELKNALPALLCQGDTVLLKASHGMGFAALVDMLAG